MTPIESARRAFDQDFHVTVLIEELSELQKELCKFLRHKEEDTALGLSFKQRLCAKRIASEIADVKMRIQEIEYIFDLSSEINAESINSISKFEKTIQEKNGKKT